MKVLYIIDSLTTGGKERQLVELLKGMNTHKDIKISLIILSNEINYDCINDLNIEINIIERKYKKDVSVFNKIYNICKNFNPDIIHSWELMCSLYIIPVVKYIKAKFVNGIIRNAFNNTDFFKSKNYLLLSFSFLCSNIVLANSHAGLKNYNVPKHKSYVIYNGFDFNRVNNVQNKEYVKNKYKIVTDNTVGMVARFHKHKDYYSFIMSALNILEKRNNVTFLTVGDGSTLNTCKKLVPDKYKDNILFLGNQKNVESIINVFDIGVLASNEEGISNAIMEYMAFEKPVVATMNDGNSELVQDKKTGFLVKPNNIIDLSEKIEFLLDNNYIAKAMGKSGNVRLQKDFSVEKMTEEHIKLYKIMLQEI